MDNIVSKWLNNLSRNIDDLDISFELFIWLKQRKYVTVGSLSRLDTADFINVYNYKKDLFYELFDVVSNIGFDPISFYEIDGTLFISSNKEYPANLLAAINNTSIDDLNIFISKDKKMGIEVALSGLREREKNILLLRYKYCCTLKKIGDLYGLSNERIRQIINETLHELSESPRSRVLLEQGLIGYIEDVVKERIGRKEMSLILRGYRCGYHEGYSAGKNNDNNQLNKKILDEPVSALDLSVRAYNILIRSGVNQIGDLILFYNTAEDIIKIKGLGSSTAREIATKLTELEICNDAWKDFL